MSSSKPQEIGMVSGELDGKGSVGKTVTPELKEEQIEAAEERAIDTAERIARHKGYYVVTLEDGETEVRCRNAKVGQIGMVLKFMRHVIKALEIKSTKPEYLKARIEQIQENPEELLDLLDTVDSHLWIVVAGLTDLPNPVAVQELDLDDAMMIGKVLWELNRDFFLKKVLPLALGTIRVK